MEDADHTNDQEIISDPNVTEEAVEPEVDVASLTPEQLVGVPDGTVLPDGETVVYDYDENNQFTGWHKEAAANG